LIFGIGTDIVSISRIESNLDRFGERFVDRILADEEKHVYQDTIKKEHFLAKRFAAKEAAAKALGTGFRDGLILQNIVIQNDELGKPELTFCGAALTLIQQNAIKQSFISLSDEDRYAVAYVILTC
jgi:holo-[acyl-carrier protein] synthase